MLVPCHAVYLGGGNELASADSRWVLQEFQRGEPPKYIEHIRFAVDLAAAEPDSLLVFSGGQTRLEAGPISEAQSYWIAAEDFHWWDKPDVSVRATTEEFARDSFENLLFGIARFRESTGHYPMSIEVVGWQFKAERFDLHRQTLRWPSGIRFKYHGVNDPQDLATSLAGEAEVLAAFRRDPFASEAELLAKRRRRNPFRRHESFARIRPACASNCRRGCR